MRKTKQNIEWLGKENFIHMDTEREGIPLISAEKCLAWI